MPCTFVGWRHPTCSGLGKGSITKTELMSPETIAKYGGYGVDANGDGIADPYDIEDAVFSLCELLIQIRSLRQGILRKLFINTTIARNMLRMCYITTSCMMIFTMSSSDCSLT